MASCNRWRASRWGASRRRAVAGGRLAGGGRASKGGARRATKACSGDKSRRRESTDVGPRCFSGVGSRPHSLLRATSRQSCSHACSGAHRLRRPAAILRLSEAAAARLVEEHEDLRKVRAHSNGRTAPLPSALLIHQPTDPQPPTRPTRARPTREGALDPEAPACRLIRPDAECRKVGGVSDRHAPGGHVRSQRDRRDLREVALAEADRHELRRRLKRLGMFDRVTFVGRKNFVTAGAVSETPRAAPWSATSWLRKSASNTRGRLQLFLRARGSPCRDPGLQPLTS